MRPSCRATSSAAAGDAQSRRSSPAEGAPRCAESCGMSRATASHSEGVIAICSSTVVSIAFRCLQYIAKIIFLAELHARTRQSRKKRLILPRARFRNDGFRPSGSKGNAVRIGNSSRCCELHPAFRHLGHCSRTGTGRRRNGNESEDLPTAPRNATQPCGEWGDAPADENRLRSRAPRSPHRNCRNDPR